MVITKIDKKEITAEGRLVWIDMAKLLVILLVLIGHFIQVYDSNYRQSGLFLFIYSFHMPLFMMLSGYLLDFKKLLCWKKISRDRFLQLVLPSVLWCVIFFLVRKLLVDDGRLLSQSLWYGLWFLKSLFACTIILVFTFNVIKQRFLSLIVAIGISQLTCFMPHVWFLQINIMLPCIICGMYLREFMNKYEGYITITCLVIYVALMFGYDEHVLYPDLTKLLTSRWFSVYGIILYKLLVGVTGAISAIGLCRILFSKNRSGCFTKLSTLGKYTLEIYILQTLLLEIVLADLFGIDMEAHYYLITWIAFPILSFILLMVCVFLCSQMQRVGLGWMFNFNQLFK